MPPHSARDCWLTDRHAQRLTVWTMNLESTTAPPRSPRPSLTPGRVSGRGLVRAARDSGYLLVALFAAHMGVSLRSLGHRQRHVRFRLQRDALGPCDGSTHGRIAVSRTGHCRSGCREPVALPAAPVRGACTRDRPAVLRRRRAVVRFSSSAPWPSHSGRWMCETSAAGQWQQSLRLSWAMSSWGT